jgi:hypothetical protein
VSSSPRDFDEFFRREFVPLVAHLRKLGFGLEESKDADAAAATERAKTDPGSPTAVFSRPIG